MKNTQEKKISRSYHLLRDRSLIKSQGGGGVGGVVLERGYNFKTSPFLGGKFFTGKGGQIL